MFSKTASILTYRPNMCNKTEAKFIEPDSVSIDKKESFMNSRLVYKNDKIVRDSSFYCKLVLPDIIELGDTLFFDLYIVFPFMKSYDKTLTKIMNSECTEVESFDAMKPGHKYNIPYWKKGYFVPRKRGLGYLFGYIIEENIKNKVYYEHYFKKSYKVE